MSIKVQAPLLTIAVLGSLLAGCGGMRQAQKNPIDIHLGKPTGPGTVESPPPATPINLSVQYSTNTQTLLSWLDQSDDESGFRVQRSLSEATGFSTIATVSSNTENFTDTTITGGIVYFYRVLAYNNDGDSSPTNVEKIAAPQLNNSLISSRSSGGSSVTITGANFNSGTIVRINSSLDVVPTAASSTSLTFTVPSAAASGSNSVGRFVVSVVNADSQSDSQLAALAYLGSPGIWLDANDASTFTLIDVAGVNFVSQWRDKSGNAQHAFQNTAGFRPRHIPASINEKSAVVFDRNASTRLQINPTGAFATALSSDFTLFTVYRVVQLFPAAGTNASSGVFVRPGYHKLIYVSGTGGVSANLWNTSAASFNHFGAAGTVSVGNSNLTTMRYAPSADSSIRGWTNSSTHSGGVATFSGTVHNNSVATPYYLGCADPSNAGYLWYLTGAVAEVLLIPSALNDTDRLAIESYLSEKWNLN